MTAQVAVSLAPSWLDQDADVRSFRRGDRTRPAHGLGAMGRLFGWLGVLSLV